MRFRLTAIVQLLIATVAPVFCRSQDDPEGTLPPVIVRPDTESAPNLDEVEADSTIFDQSLSYPSLNDLQLGSSDGFGDQTGVWRSRKSLFDTPAAASVTTRDQIIEKQAPDMFHALQNEVGVLMQSTAAGQASPFVRAVSRQRSPATCRPCPPSPSQYPPTPGQWRSAECSHLPSRQPGSA